MRFNKRDNHLDKHREQTGEMVIHIRSASRVGYSDFGANRKRIEWIRSKFNK